MAVADAQAMLQCGYVPLDLVPLEKRPIGEAWQTTTPEIARARWETAPADANIGVLCGDIVTIVDFDTKGEPSGRQVYDDLKRRNPHIFDGAIVEETPSGGIHATYQGIRSAEKTFARFVIDGAYVDVEVLRGRRQAVVAPSRTSKGAYRSINGRTHQNTPSSHLPPLPQVFADAIALYERMEREKRASVPVRDTPGVEELDDDDLTVVIESSVDAYLVGATETHRHDNALGLARMLAGCGIGDSELTRAVERYFNKCSRRANPGEVDGIVMDAMRNPDSDPAIPWKKVWEARERRPEYAKPVLRDAAGNVVKIEEKLAKANAAQEQARAQRIESENRGNEIDPTFGTTVQECRDAALDLMAAHMNEPKEWRCYTTTDDYPEPVWIVQDWIPLEGVTIIHSEPGVGKTLICQYIMTRVALGKPVFPPRIKTGPAGEAPVDDIEELPVKKCPCLMLQLDQAAAITGNRFKWFRAAENLKAADPLDVYFYAPEDWVSVTNPKDNSTLRYYIQKHKAELLVVDTLSFAAGNIPENSDDMKNIMLAFSKIAKELHIAVVILHHDRKEYSTQGGSAQQKIRGHTSIPASAEVCIGLSKTDPNGLTFELSMDKNRLGEKRIMFVEWSPGKHPAKDITITGRFYGVRGEDASEAKDATVKAVIIEILTREGEVKGKNTLIGLTHERLKKDGIRGGEKVVIRAINELDKDEKITSSIGFRGVRIFKLPGGI